jgi:parallel beta-helix repeat protein
MNDHNLKNQNTMIRLFTIIALITMATGNSFSQTIISVGGNYPGNVNWVADTVKVTSDITVGGWLTINPGTTVKFLGNFSIETHGIKAKGTEPKIIRFTIKDTTGFSKFNLGSGGWSGITDLGTANSSDTSVLAYCHFEYGKRINDLIPYFKGLLKFGDNTSKVRIDHCVFRNNYAKDGAIIKSDRSTKILSCDVSDNYSSAMSLRMADVSSSSISKNKGTGIEVWDKEYNITGNTITDNTGYGLYCYQSKKISVSNNVISGNLLEGVNLFQVITGAFCGEIADRTIWMADTIKVFCDVTVRDMLVIRPGTRVEFQGNYGLDVDSLYTEGTQADSIVYTINDTTGFSDFNIEKGGWKGIDINGYLSMNYCVMEYVKNLTLGSSWHTQNSMIRLGSGDDILKHKIIANSYFRNNFSKNAPGLILVTRGYTNVMYNSFIHNFSTPFYSKNYSQILIGNTFAYNKGTAISINGDTGSPQIISNIIHDNDGWGVEITGASFSTAFVNNNRILNNMGGIHVFSIDGFLEMLNNLIVNNIGYGGILIYQAPLKMFNNLISHNVNLTGKGGGISITLCYGSIINNTISYNTADYGGGIFINDFSNGETSLKFINSIITNNTSSTGKQIIRFYQNQYSDTTKATVDLINCDVEGITQEDITGSFLSDIDKDPGFVDPSHNNFNLIDNSPCINSGIQDTTGLKLLARDLAGNPRIYPGLVKRIDMGAYEYQGDKFAIARQPLDKEACESTSVTLETNATGTVLGYQWQKNGKNITSAIQSVYTISPVIPGDSGTYNCLIRALNHTFSTDTVHLVTKPLPKIQKQTESFDICAGQDTLLAMQVAEPNKMNFAWYFNNALIPGSDTTCLLLTNVSMDNGGPYWGTVSNLCGTDTSYSFLLTVNPLPIINLGNDTTITTNDTLILDAGNNFSFYKWNTGSEDETLSVFGYAPGGHEFAVQVTDENNCVSGDTILVIFTAATAVDQFLSDEEVTFYPNPVTDKIYFMSQKDLSGGVLVSIADNSGRICSQQHFSEIKAGWKYDVDISGLPGGFYSLLITHQNNLRIKKIIKI